MGSIEGIWLEIGNGRSDSSRASDLRLNRLEFRIWSITARSMAQFRATRARAVFAHVRRRKVFRDCAATFAKIPSNGQILHVTSFISSIVISDLLELLLNNKYLWPRDNELIEKSRREISYFSISDNKSSDSLFFHFSASFRRQLQSLQSTISEIRYARWFSPGVLLDY